MKQIYLKKKKYFNNKNFSLKGGRWGRLRGGTVGLSKQWDTPRTIKNKNSATKKTLNKNILSQKKRKFNETSNGNGYNQTNQRKL